MKLRYYQKEAAFAACQSVLETPQQKSVVGLPTGSGKTPTMGAIVWYLTVKHNKKILIVSHVKEILEQNCATVKNMCDTEIGLYSSMLNSKTIQDVTVAGIHSIYNKTELFHEFDVILIDECHLVGAAESSMYQQLFDGLPSASIVGMTATPYRLDCGFIYSDHEKAYFDEIVIDYTRGKKYQQLESEGFLTPLNYNWTQFEFDTSSIDVLAGDYNQGQLSDKFDRADVTMRAVNEILVKGQNKNKWIVFAIDIEHAENINRILNDSGIASGVIHSKTKNRDELMAAYREDKLKCLVNVVILTTGVDVRTIDLIADLSPTLSASRHVQKLGRGVRTHDSKDECLVLDFAGNLEKLGPIHDPVIKKPGKDTGEETEPPMKKCGGCEKMHYSSVKECSECGFVFQFKHGLSAKALQTIINKKPIWLEVDNTEYEYSTNSAYAPAYLTVKYQCNALVIVKTVNLEQGGSATINAKQWYKERLGKDVSSTKDGFMQREHFKETEKILVERINNDNIVTDELLK